MVLTCSAYNCSNRYDKNKPTLSFHRFPFSKPDLLKKWILAVRRKNWQPTKYSVLCSSHFLPEDFEPMLPGSVVRKLIPTAVPSVFDYSTSLQRPRNKRRRVHDLQQNITDEKRGITGDAQRRRRAERARLVRQRQREEQIAERRLTDAEWQQLQYLRLRLSEEQILAKRLDDAERHHQFHMNARMTICCVPGCTSTHGRDENISFHEFPVDVMRREKWLKVFPRKNWKPNFNSNSSRICSRHFKEGDFKLFPESKKRRYLLKHAIPSLFLEDPNCKSNPIEKRYCDPQYLQLDIHAQSKLEINNYNIKVGCLTEKLLKEKGDLDDCRKTFCDYEINLHEVSELQKKWKNLRTCFAREIRLSRELSKQPNASSDASAKKRRKYIYFDQLSFLLPTFDEQDAAEEMMEDEVVTKENETVKNEEAVKGSEKRKGDEGLKGITKKPKNIEVENFNPQKGPRKKILDYSYEERLLEILQKKNEENSIVDEEKYFLLSLLPTFKTFDDEQKYVAKMEILQTMRRVQMFRCLNPSNSQSQQSGASRPASSFAGAATPEPTSTGSFINAASRASTSISSLTMPPSTSTNSFTNDVMPASTSTSTNVDIDYDVDAQTTFICKTEVLSPEPPENDDDGSMSCM